jgi:choice-of-anchor C domain-containing protein
MFRFLVAGLVALAAQPAAAVSFVNGSFETGNFTGAAFDELTAPSTDIAGWQVGPLGVDWAASLWRASKGLRSVELASTDRGQIFQRLTGLTVGRTYRVGFDVAGNPFGGPATYGFGTSTSGAQVTNFTVDVTAANSPTNMGWGRRFVTFVAVASNQNFSFIGRTSGPYGAVIDNVKIAAVPEPKGWALLILGFGMVGLVARRRSRPLTLAA